MTGVAPRICLGLLGKPCNNRVRGASRCKDCASAYEQLREASRAGTRDTDNPWRWVYRDKRWRPARLACLKRDSYTCVDCPHHDPTGSTLQADHVHPLQDGGEPFDVDNLATRCATCHARAEQRRRKARS